MIPYGRQTIDEDDVEAVVRVLRSDWLTTGPAIPTFEEGIAARTGAKHAVAFANGTAALHGAVAAAGIGPGSRVLTSAMSFVASANCARYVGADVGFVDIDPETLNLDVASVGACDALVGVHFAGLPARLDRLAHRPSVVIEDAAHALGATTPDGPVGSCAASDMCVFSFHPVKAVTTGEGGAVTTNSDELAERLRVFRNHGIVRKPERGGWYYEVESLGFNYRLTDIQAVLGTSQLTKLERFVERRQALAERYRRLLADLDVRLPPAPADGYSHAYHLFPVRVHDRDRVFAALRDDGIGVQVHYVPIHHHPIYAGVGAVLPSTDEAYRELISLPLYPGLSDEEQDQVVAALGRALCRP